METTQVRGAHKNLVAVGWQNGTLEVAFRGGRRYHFGGVPEDVKDKLLRSPYPDRLFHQTVRGKYVSERVDTPPSKPFPQHLIDWNDLPF
jgi:hypothetical protein